MDGVDLFVSLRGISPLATAGVVDTRKGVENGVGEDNEVGVVNNWSGSEDSEGEGKGVDNLCGVEDMEVGVDNLCGSEVVVVGVGLVDSLYGSDDVAEGNLHKHTFFSG